MVANMTDRPEASRLLVILSGRSKGNRLHDGCDSCYRAVLEGQAMLVLDDEKFYPGFCLRCVSWAYQELFPEAGGIELSASPEDVKNLSVEAGGVRRECDGCLGRIGDGERFLRYEGWRSCRECVRGAYREIFSRDITSVSEE